MTEGDALDGLTFYLFASWFADKKKLKKTDKYSPNLVDFDCNCRVTQMELEHWMVFCVEISTKNEMDLVNAEFFLDDLIRHDTKCFRRVRVTFFFFLGLLLVPFLYLVYCEWKG